MTTMRARRRRSSHDHASLSPAASWRPHSTLHPSPDRYGGRYGAGFGSRITTRLLGAEYLDLGLDLDGETQRQLRHSNRRTGVPSRFGAVHLHDQVREPVGDVGLLIEAGP